MKAVELNNLLGQIKTYKISFSSIELWSECTVLNELLDQCEMVSDRWHTDMDSLEINNKKYKGVIDDIGLIDASVTTERYQMSNNQNDGIANIELNVKNVGNENSENILECIDKMKKYSGMIDVDFEYGADVFKKG